MGKIETGKHLPINKLGKKEFSKQGEQWLTKENLSGGTDVEESTGTSSAGGYVTGMNPFNMTNTKGVHVRSGYKPKKNKKSKNKTMGLPIYTFREEDGRKSFKIKKTNLVGLLAETFLTEDEIGESTGQYSQPQIWAKDIAKSYFSKKPWWKGGKFVKFDPKCASYNNKENCSQGAKGGAHKTKLVGEGGKTKKGIAESIANKTGKSKKYVETMIEAYLSKKSKTNE